MTDFDFMDPASDACAYAETVADELGEEALTGYFEALVGELFGLVPGFRERFSDSLLSELKEEIVRREDPKHSHATITLIESIEADWRSND